MPLPEAKGWPVKYLMQTGGPVNVKYDTETARQLVQKAFKEAYGDDIERMEIVIENGKNGYRHFHCIMKFKKERKPMAKPKNTMIKNEVLVTQGVNEKGEPAKPNMGSHSVSKESVPKAWDIMHNYIRNPTKRKTLDDGSLEYHDTTPTPEEMYQAIFKHPTGSKERNVAIAEYHLHMLDLMRYGVKGVVLN